MRSRFGSWIKQQREELGMTQLDVAMFMGYDYSVMVSQIERGVSAMPTGDLRMWAEVLRMKADELAKQYLYYCQPFIYECLYGKDPYALEKLPKPPRTIKSSPGRSTARRTPTRA
ncbi:helix-turn-helix domain-containing protein [Ralstonia solanacearum]